MPPKSLKYERSSDDAKEILNSQNISLYDLKYVCESNTPPQDGRAYCPPIFDKLHNCWNYTLGGSSSFLPCPTSIPGFNPNAFAEKLCHTNGSWFTDPDTGKHWTNYMPCVTNSEDLGSVYVYLVGYCLSTISLVTSLYIFFTFKQLDCHRVTLHKNLFACFLANALSWIAYYSVIFDADVVHHNPGWCQFIHVVATYFTTASYFWMFSEGIYLVVILVVPFNKGNRLLAACVITGWGIPLLLTIIYGVGRLLVEQPQRCWLSTSKLTYIIHIPVIIALAANFVMLFFIICLLWQKMQAPSSLEEMQWSKTAKAVFILVPLLGIQNILFLVEPPVGSKLSSVHTYFNAVLTSFQGVLVSLLLCFLNSEVIWLVKRQLLQHTLLRGNGAGNSNQRRETFTTEMLNATAGSNNSPSINLTSPSGEHGKTASYM